MTREKSLTTIDTNCEQATHHLIVSISLRHTI